MFLSPATVYSHVKRQSPNGIKVMSGEVVSTPTPNTFIPYRKDVAGVLTLAVGLELPFMIPVIDPVYCWHWDNVTFFSEYPPGLLERRYIRLVVNANGHTFVYALKPLNSLTMIERTIDENLNIGRALLVGHGNDSRMSYTTLANDPIKTQE